MFHSLIKIALQKPLTFIVAAILLSGFGLLAALRMPVDIFPSIRIPVVAVAWQYSGMAPEDMLNRIVTPYQRALTTTVSDIEHIESQSLPGFGIIKIFFQPSVNIATATAQVTAISQTMVRLMPPGTNPPFIVNYDASTVPILQLAMSGEGLTEQQLNDLGMAQIRNQLITLPGVAMPAPSGGKQRQIQLDLDPQALLRYGLAARDVTAAITLQNQVNPAGAIKIGSSQYNVRLNNAADTLDAIRNIPIKVVNGATLYVRDVATVRDGSSPQTNVVQVENGRSVLLTVLKNGATSTLDIVENVKATLPRILVGLPDSLKVLPVGDQSVFVRAAIENVLHEAALVAVLIALLVLLFLGSWRSTLIITASIPLSILTAVAVLNLFGQTLNVMTLGGLAIAIGILVDGATVMIENINRQLEEGADVTSAITQGAAQILTPAFVSLLCICIVFVPMFFLPGIAGYLFVPMALAVIFAMVASFVLSLTVVLTLSHYLLKPHALKPHQPASALPVAGQPVTDQSTDVLPAGTLPTAPFSAEPRTPALLWPLIRLQQGFERRFNRLRQRYMAVLSQILLARRWFAGCFMALVLLSFALLPFLGRNFFPDVDSGRLLLHVRVPPGLKIEETAARFEQISHAVRQLIPPEELASVISNIGMSPSLVSAIYNNSGTIGPQDGDMMISLRPGHAPSAHYMALLRKALPAQFPGASFAFLPADITSQILNFGAPSPIDIQVTSRDLHANRNFARLLLRELQQVPGLADLRIQQPGSSPQLDIRIDRSRLSQYGLTSQDVTGSLGGSLAGSSQTSPVFFIQPQSGVSYPVVAQVPEYLMASSSALENIPVSGPAATGVQPLGGLATISRSSTLPVASQYNIQPMINLFGATAGRDLGAVAADIEAVIARLAPQKPATVQVTLRGQYQTMNTAFSGLGYGLLGAIVLIYLLIVVNFQSWRDPLVIISALPAALAGIVWLLFISGTPLSVPALTGAIMCMGMATANSVLLISFAREKLAEHADPLRAALEAGFTRFRPVLMTALAMVIGMLPMALGLGEGAEQNAPLGRAVIGGLIAATVATLLFVPAVFSLAHRRHAAPAPAYPEAMPAHV